MHLNKDTILCISIASRPGRFGTAVHNAAYKALRLNYIYKAFGTSDLPGAIAGVKALGIKGCSVTMPFKEKVIGYLDLLDKDARAIGAVNTIVNENGKLKGYNTDVYGARKVLEGLKLKRNVSVLLLGAGGAAKAILYALYTLGFKNITVSNRTASKLKKLKNLAHFSTVPWQKRSIFPADLIINATPIGMAPQSHQMPVEAESLKRSMVVMDTVVTPIESRLIRLSKRLGKRVAPGYQMSLHQAVAQFELYTHHTAPFSVMQKAVLDLLKNP